MVYCRVYLSLIFVLSITVFVYFRFALQNFIIAENEQSPVECANNGNIHQPWGPGTGEIQAFPSSVGAQQRPVKGGGTIMKTSLRQKEILDIVRRQGKASVEDLVAHFSVTPQTIRRDLTDLAGAGEIDRVHGGAVLASGTHNISYQERRLLEHDAKLHMAKACAALIPDNASLFLNIGTSTEAVSRELLGHRDIMAVTNNMNVANILMENSHCEVLVAGGTLRRQDGGIVGDLAARFIEQFKVDYAIIGASAIDLDGDLLDYDIQEVRVSKSIIRQSRQVILIADHTKLQRQAPIRICSLADIDHLFTDLPLPAPLAAKCKEWGTAVHICSQEPA